MQRIKLMTDSACDLPGSLARQLGIEVIPIPIAVDGKGYLEGVDFTPREFYTILQQAKQIPTTSQISPVTYCERYHAAYQQGYTDVILMGISSTASATYAPRTRRICSLKTSRRQRNPFESTSSTPRPSLWATATR